MTDDRERIYLNRTVLRLTGIDLACYRPAQLERRLKTFMHRVGARSLVECAALIQQNAATLQGFKDFFTINVSEFFRDADRFALLERELLPEQVAQRRNLRIWSAACSHGAEPYSVSILLREIAPDGYHRILATDVDATILATARGGSAYSASDVRNVDPGRLTTHFTPGTDGTWSVRPEVKALVEFREHNLLEPPPRQGFDLILCRNVMIYFVPAAKALLFDRLIGALRPGGLLFVGGTEILPRGLGVSPVAPSFYRKEPAASFAVAR